MMWFRFSLCSIAIYTYKFINRRVSSRTNPSVIPMLRLSCNSSDRSFISSVRFRPFFHPQFTENSCIPMASGSMALATPRASPALLIRISTCAMPAAWKAGGIRWHSMGFLHFLGVHGFCVPTVTHTTKHVCISLSQKNSELLNWPTTNGLYLSVTKLGIPIFNGRLMGESSNEVVHNSRPSIGWVRWGHDWQITTELLHPKGGELGTSRLANWHNHKLTPLDGHHSLIGWSKPLTMSPWRWRNLKPSGLEQIQLKVSRSCWRILQVYGICN